MTLSSLHQAFEKVSSGEGGVVVVCKVMFLLHLVAVEVITILIEVGEFFHICLMDTVRALVNPGGVVIIALHCTNLMTLTQQ